MAGLDVKNMIHSKVGNVIISILLGVGLATFFRKACTERNCMVFKAPPLKKLNGQVYKYNDKCYKFSSQATKCSKNKKNVLFS